MTDNPATPLNQDDTTEVEQEKTESILFNQRYEAKTGTFVAAETPLASAPRLDMRWDIQIRTRYTTYFNSIGVTYFNYII